MPHLAIGFFFFVGINKYEIAKVSKIQNNNMVDSQFSHDVILSIHRLGLSRTSPSSPSPLVVVRRPSFPTPPRTQLVKIFRLFVFFYVVPAGEDVTLKRRERRDHTSS
jgi:hypothetical protein